MTTNKQELAADLHRYLTTNGISYKTVQIKSGVYSSHVGRFIKRQTSFSFDSFLRVLDSLDLKLIIEDKDADWGTDMARLRMMPKKLYHGERIEAREYVTEEGFEGRVDLFESIEQVLKFIPTPCDIYEIRLGKLRRKSFDVVQHPFGTMYSYFENIPAEAIVNRVTYR